MAHGNEVNKNGPFAGFAGADRPGQGLASSLAEKDRATIRASLKIVATFSN
jgi:hypothetical protein